MKTTSAKNERIIEALMSVGFSEVYARNIAYGNKQMKDLEKAKTMSKAPHYISIDIWADLYKKKG